MDYTKLPRHFIYKDRKDLDEFPVCSRFDYTTLEEYFLEELEQRPFIKESYDAPEIILKIFNNARYIVTLISMENHPNHYLRRYLKIAGSDDRNITIANHAMPATMALVKNYLCNYMPTLYKDSKIVEDITNNFDTDAWKEMSPGGHDDFFKLVNRYIVEHSGWLSDPDFEPRDVREVINDPFTTARDISENIDFLMESLEKKVEIFDEEIAPLNAMYKKVESWFPSDMDDDMHKELALGKIEERLKKLDPNDAFGFYNIMNDMEKSLYNGTPVSPKTKEEIDKYMKKTLGVGMDKIKAAPVANQDDTENSPKSNNENEDEKKSLEVQLANEQEKNEKLEEEVEFHKNERDEMLRELLLTIIHKESDVEEFLELIDGRSDSEIADIVKENAIRYKIADKMKRRPLWQILHAAKLYTATEQNWSTALRN